MKIDLVDCMHFVIVSSSVQIHHAKCAEGVALCLIGGGLGWDSSVTFWGGPGWDGSVTL